MYLFICYFFLASSLTSIHHFYSTRRSTVSLANGDVYSDSQMSITVPYWLVKCEYRLLYTTWEQRKWLDFSRVLSPIVHAVIHLDRRETKEVRERERRMKRKRRSWWAELRVKHDLQGGGGGVSGIGRIGSLMTLERKEKKGERKIHLRSGEGVAYSQIHIHTHTCVYMYIHMNSYGGYKPITQTSNCAFFYLSLFFFLFSLVGSRREKKRKKKGNRRRPTKWCAGIWEEPAGVHIHIHKRARRYLST